MPPEDPGEVGTTPSAQEPFAVLERRLRQAQNTLEVRLGERSIARERADGRQIAAQMRGAEAFVEARLEDVAEYEVARIEVIAKHVSELAAARPDVLDVLRRKLLSTDIGDYYGGRYEGAVAAALTRRGVPYLYQVRDGPDFALRADATYVGIECTSARLEAPEDPDPFHKIETALTDKATKPYASRRVAVAIDVTILQARSRRAGGNLLGDDLEPRLGDLLYRTPFGALIVTAQMFDDRVRPRNVMGPYRRVDHAEIDPVLRKLLEHAFPPGTGERTPLAWVSHLT